MEIDSQYNINVVILLVVLAILSITSNCWEDDLHWYSVEVFGKTSVLKLL